MSCHPFKSSVPYIKLSLSAFFFLVAGQASYTGAQSVRPGPPSPVSVLGFAPGDDRKIADWKTITDYFNHLAHSSDRVRVEEVGRSTLNRPLIAVFISSPGNIRDLEKYRDIQRKLSDPRLVRSDSERDSLIREGKTVVVISCSIHSTEIVASQMSMQLAYDLASRQDIETRHILHNTIVILIPSPNPDGIDIVANWYRKTLGTPYEGKEPPELYHFYAGHDDNRDWFMLDLKETQLISSLLWKTWFPEIVYDVHQQGATGSRFFIPPFFDPPNPHIAPVLLRHVGLIGMKMASDLESAGVKGVITNAMYDTWWHGGFRTAPYFHNSIGILSEAASARLMTPMSVTRDQLAHSATRGMHSALEATTNFPDPWQGGIWRPRDILNAELIAASSLLSLASVYRENYLKDFYELSRKSVSESESSRSPLAYLIPAGQGRDENVAKMITALMQQGVEVFRLDRELAYTAVSGAVEAGEGKSGNSRNTSEAPAGSYLIFLQQPSRANVQALFELQMYPNRLTPNGEAERPYDVAGWTLPLQMDIETFPVASIREAPAERRLTLLSSEGQVRSDLSLPPRLQSKSPIENPVKAKVRVGIYKGWTANSDEGWTRYVFDTFNLPYESLSNSGIRGEDLSIRYDVIILPSAKSSEIINGNLAGSYPIEYTGGIGEAGLKNLRKFVEGGGTLICFDASTEFAIKSFSLPLRNVLEGLKTSEFYCPGSILRIKVDTTQAIGRGMSHDTDAYFINSSAFEATEPQRVRVIATFADRNVLHSGWLLGQSRIAGKIALAEVSMGKGRVVLFGFRPQHRGQTWGTFPFIFNAMSSAVR